MSCKNHEQKYSYCPYLVIQSLADEPPVMFGYLNLLQLVVLHQLYVKREIYH